MASTENLPALPKWTNDDDNNSSNASDHYEEGGIISWVDTLINENAIIVI